MKRARAAALLAAVLALFLLAWHLAGGRGAERAPHADPRASPDPADAAQGVAAASDPSTRAPPAPPLDLSFHVETGAGAIRVELSIRPAEERVHLRAAGSSLLGSVGPGSGSSECEFSYRGRTLRARIAWDDALRLVGTSIAAERPPAALDPAGAAYVLERRRQLRGGVATDFAATLRPSE